MGRPVDSRASRRWGDLSRKLADYIFNSIINGVATLHRVSIAHADLSPKNVLVRGSPHFIEDYRSLQVKVCDFGCSLNYGESLECDVRVGALVSRSPELFLHSRPVMASTDLWSVGVIGVLLSVGMTDIAFNNGEWPLASGDSKAMRGMRKYSGMATYSLQDIQLVNHDHNEGLVGCDAKTWS